MAKIGEGDPRWIVQERKDGANVNSWHWQEKALDERVHEQLKQIFTNFPLADGPVDGLTDVKVAELSEISGDCTIAHRKQKIMCYFELKMSLKYSARSVDGDENVGGKIAVPDVDHDSFREDDYTMTVAASDKGAAQTKAENYVRTQGRQRIRKVIRDYFEALFAEHQVGKNVPQKPTGAAAAASSEGAAAAAAAAASSPTTGAPKAKSTSGAPTSGVAAHDATSFETTLIWRVPREELFAVLTDAPRASAYTRSPAKIDPRPSGVFEFLGGAITGYYVDVKHPEKLSMQWRLSSWPSNVFSSVVIQMTNEEAGVTRMDFAQVGIPAGDMERCKSGWFANFFDPIKAVFGFSYTVK